METGSAYPCTLNCKIGSVSEGAISIDFALICGYYGYMFNTPLQKQQSKLHGYFFSSLRTTPESENSKLFFPSLLFFIYFASWVGRKLRLRLCPVKSKLKVKKLPMRASLFSIKTLFWTTGNIFSLSFSHWIKKKEKKKGAYGLNFSSSPFYSRQQV